jgi:hypothetical protein
MRTVHDIRREDAAIRKWVPAVTEAAVAFERRWTLAALKRVNPDIHHRLLEQRGLFDKAATTGTPKEIEDHGAAMVRGYAKAVSVLEAVGEPDNAYLLGQDPRTGFRVAIGEQKAAAARVVELHGRSVIWITPDEVAAIIANIEAFKPIATIKRLFPGAEILDVCPGEPAKEDMAVG